MYKNPNVLFDAGAAGVILAQGQAGCGVAAPIIRYRINNYVPTYKNFHFRNRI